MARTDSTLDAIDLTKGPTNGGTRAAKLDLFAEFFVAGRFAVAGWNVYFPRRDRGFDFVVSKAIGPDGAQVLRPVQVKGKYPTAEKGDKDVYGFVGRITEFHQDMVLAIPFFERADLGPPACIAYMPRSRIKPHAQGSRCEPATFRNGSPAARRDFTHYFDDVGLSVLEHVDWK